MPEPFRSAIVYFSRPGKNYANGQIVDLPVGNTEIAALMIKELTHSDIFRVVPLKDYPTEYRDCTKRAHAEYSAGFRPGYQGHFSLNRYSMLFLGYPNWCGTLPMILWTFLEQQDTAGKIILPFCTNEGSGMGRSLQDLHDLCPNADIRKGLAIHGSEVKDALPAIKEWIGSQL